MGVDSIDDLRIILSGQSREYPGFKGEDWRDRTWHYLLTSYG